MFQSCAASSTTNDICGHIYFEMMRDIVVGNRNIGRRECQYKYLKEWRLHLWRLQNSMMQALKRLQFCNETQNLVYVHGTWPCIVEIAFVLKCSSNPWTAIHCIYDERWATTTNLHAWGDCEQRSCVALHDQEVYTHAMACKVGGKLKDEDCVRSSFAQLRIYLHCMCCKHVLQVDITRRS